MGQVGGGVDFAARLIAPELSKVLGQSVVVDNRAGEVVPADTVAKAAPDGHTLLMNGSSLLFLPLMRKNAPYDVVKSFVHITLAHQSSTVLVVYPALPTVAASGYPGFECISVNGVMAPAGTPAAIVNRLNREIVLILQQKKIRELFFGAGSEVIGSTPEEFTRLIKSELAKWGKIVADAGIKAD